MVEDFSSWEPFVNGREVYWAEKRTILWGGEGDGPLHGKTGGGLGLDYEHWGIGSGKAREDSVVS